MDLRRGPGNYARPSMDVGTFCAQSHVLIVAGKGGVGKTTMSAALARMAAGAGKSVLIVELEGKSGITAAFGRREDLGYEEVLLVPATTDASGTQTGSVRARRLTPDDALIEYLEDHGLRRVSKRLAHSGVLDVVSTAIPGIRDVLVLGKVKQLERGGAADLIVVDAPATGHAITFLTSASGLVNAARGGPLRTQAEDVVELLSDPARCRVILVTLPEELPVSETIESAYTLEDKAGVQLGPVIVNACDPDPVGLDQPVAQVAAAAGGDARTGSPGCARGRPANSAWPATPSSPNKSSGSAATCRCPTCCVPALDAESIGSDETRCWPTRWRTRWPRSWRGGRMSSTDGAAGAAGAGAPAADGATPPAPTTLPELVAERAVIVCCGSGGVGKTTVSATFALAAARAGRRSCVVTVDPARRLADALGVQSLPNTPSEVQGDWPGHLHALMLDSKGTFDDLVQRYARTPDQADSILANRLYQNLAGALSGTQEYMAMEKLYELVHSDEFDVVVVDTPPTRNALDLLDAPRRLTRFLENRLFRALLVPTRMSLRALGVATQALLRTIAKVAGAEIVQDAVAFFQAFEGMEDGFRSRASAVHELLADPATAYVLVTSARPDAIAEAGYFAEKLGERDVAVAALVVNRIAPSFGDGAADEPRRASAAPALWKPLEANLAELNARGGTGGGGVLRPGGAGVAGARRADPALRAGRARAGRVAAGGRPPVRLTPCRLGFPTPQGVR